MKISKYFCSPPSWPYSGKGDGGAPTTPLDLFSKYCEKCQEGGGGTYKIRDPPPTLSSSLNTPLRPRYSMTRMNVHIYVYTVAELKQNSLLYITIIQYLFWREVSQVYANLAFILRAITVNIRNI